MRYKNVLLDLDGTVTDPGEGITNSIAYALKKFGLPSLSKQELYSFIGPPLIPAFQDRFGISENDSRTLLAYYREYFSERGLFENKPYDGIFELLQTLNQNGHRVLLATSKPEFYARKILEHFELSVYFTSVYGASMDEKLSKKSDIIALALASLSSSDHSDDIMVGDRFHDVLGAKASGIPCIGVLYGYGSREELVQAGADYLANKPLEILQYV